MESLHLRAGRDKSVMRRHPWIFSGAVERVYDLYRREHADLLCLVSGGAAKALTPHLVIVFRYHDNLVLEGLYFISRALMREAREGLSGVHKL